MRMTGALPKSVLILEMVGMVLLALALLLLNHYLTLPAPFNSSLAVIIMLFLGVLLMIPAALAFVWQVAQRLAPQLMKPSSDSSRSDRENENDSNH